jgi:tryptophanyl-tRNA synthetase
VASNPELATFLSQTKRSEQLWKSIQATPEKFRMLTGDRPTGKLHIGHYFGSLKSRLELQNLGVETWVLIADYQVITDREEIGSVRQFTLDLVIDYLAVGLDPEQTVIFNHSAVEGLNQLFLPFLSLVSEAELRRNPTVKAEHEASRRNLSGLLLTYPVHQACDILFCKANVVPVGKDQLPHIEQTRVIARRFNERYGNRTAHGPQNKTDGSAGAIFPEPVGLLSSAPAIPGVDGRKMSKSFANVIEIGASEAETERIIRKSQTDSERLITYSPDDRPGVSALLNYAALTTGRSESEIAAEIGDSGAGRLKQFVTASVNDYFRSIRELRREFEKNLDYVESILRRGNQRANQIAEQTLSEVRQAMGTFI